MQTKWSWLRRRSLVLRLLVLSAAAAAVPALVVSTLQRSISSGALERSIEQHQTEMSRRIAEAIDSEIRQGQQILAFVARSRLWQAGLMEDQRRALRNITRWVPTFQEAMIVDSSGQERVKVSRQGLNLPLFRRRHPVQSPYIGEPFFSGNRLPTILISEPLLPEPGRFGSGAVMAKMSFDRLGDILREIQIGPRGLAFIVNARGSLLAHPDEDQSRKHTKLDHLPVVSQWMEKPFLPTPLLEYADASGRQMISLAYPIPLLRSAVVLQQPRKDVYAPLDQMQKRFVWWTFGWVLVFMGLTLAVAWRILQPLRQLQAATDQIARGNMDVELAIHTRDELEELGKAFNRMAESLRHAERMRGDLINMVVHDLKIPLSSILPSLDHVLSGEPGQVTPEQAKFLQLSRRSGHDMLSLIQNLLDVAKMEDGKLVLHKEPFALSSWGESILYAFLPAAESARKHLTLAVGPDLPPLTADVHLLGRALGNLISNALRHTMPGTGEVSVAFFRQGNQLMVEVRDNGEGIPEEDLERIFDKFTQAGGQRANIRSGTGLGLTFCKMVVEAHGGRIVAQSAPQQGSRFVMHIPFSETDLAGATSTTPADPLAAAPLG